MELKGIEKYDLGVLFLIEIENLFKKYKYRITKVEFNSLLITTLDDYIKEKAIKLPYDFENSYKEIAQIFDLKVADFIEQRNKRMLKDAISYIDKNLSPTNAPKVAVKELNMLKSFLEFNGFILNLECSLALVKSNSVLNDILCLVVKNNIEFIKRNEIEKISTNQNIRQLILAYCFIQGIAINVNISSQELENLYLNDEEFKAKIEEHKCSFDLSNQEMAFIYNFAKKYIREDVSLSDLIYEAILGYKKACSSFTQNKEYSISAFIILYMDFYCSRVANSLVNNAFMSNYAKNFNSSVSRMIGGMNREVKTEEIAEMKNLSVLETTVLQEINKINGYNEKKNGVYSDLTKTEKMTSKSQLKNPNKKIEDILEIPRDICLLGINKLSDEDRNVLQYMYGENFEKFYDPNKLYYKSYRGIYRKAIENLKLAISTITLAEYLNVSLEVARSLTEKLSWEEKTTLFCQWYMDDLKFVISNKLPNRLRAAIDKIYQKLNGLIKMLEVEEAVQEEENNPLSDSNQLEDTVIMSDEEFDKKYEDYFMKRKIHFIINSIGLSSLEIEIISKYIGLNGNCILPDTKLTEYFNISWETVEEIIRKIIEASDYSITKENLESLRNSYKVTI